jgi:hypothetical protein
MLRWSAAASAAKFHSLVFCVFGLIILTADD